MSPFQCPSLFSILSFLEYEHGVYHPIGGCSAVMEHMARVAEDLGVDIRYGEEVKEVLFRGRKASGVRTSSGEFSGDAIVINADFAQAMTRLVPNSRRRKWTDKSIAKKRYSCSTFMLYLGIEGQYDHLSHHSIYMASDYERNLREIESDHVLSADPSLYVQNACVTDPGLAPDGCSTLYVLAPVSHAHPNIDWNREAPAFRRVVLQQLQKRLGCADIEKRIRYEKMVTPADWESDYQVYRGATFNLAHNLRQMLHLRPRNRFDEVPGTYLVGGGTHPGSGLPVIFESARITSRLLLEDLGRDHSFVDVPGSLEVPEYVG
jgi:phytoene desaturase